ncbi:MFS transporter [Elizabethkingia argentiflava]|uniref:MFS transporter n=1 Tax=Elizabethkingia argenteiflava TaxID=2681556 RepID=A0A845PUA2_9FLAO|nr:TCR/Tet family MFS transporter [Elizabethkingia argenteiflava]NAW51404.1 MFS transporter [Elizabethkingia argenteiflava]
MEKSTTNKALGFIFITLLIDITGWGIIIPVIPKLIEELIQGNISEASRYGGWLGFAYAFTQFIFAPFVGNLSDQYGRRPVILISLLGFSIDYVLLALSPSILWLFIGRVIAGMTGASITTASAYIADVSTEENRAKNFGIIGAAFGVGFIIGPVLGGILGHYGSRVPFYAAAVLCLVNFIYGYFILPESLSKSDRRSFEWKRANPIGALIMLKKYPQVSGLVVVILLVYIGTHAVNSNWSFFTMYQFNWQEKEIGLSLGLVGLLTGLVQGVLIRWITPRIGNEKSIYYGLGFLSIGMLLFSFASQAWMMLIFLIPYCLGGICGPTLQAVISGRVPPQEQGELQGALTSLISVTSIIGPPLMTNLFFFFTQPSAPFHFPGIPFFIGFLMLGGSTFIAYSHFRKNK